MKKINKVILILYTHNIIFIWDIFFCRCYSGSSPIVFLFALTMHQWTCLQSSNVKHQGSNNVVRLLRGFEQRNIKVQSGGRKSQNQGLDDWWLLLSDGKHCLANVIYIIIIIWSPAGEQSHGFSRQSGPPSQHAALLLSDTLYLPL